eukprot:1094797-Rhodomonas_salina.1
MRLPSPRPRCGFPTHNAETKKARGSPIETGRNCDAGSRKQTPSAAPVALSTARKSPEKRDRSSFEYIKQSSTSLHAA